MLVAVLAFPTTAGLKHYEGTSGLRDPVIGRDSEVLLVVIVVPVVLAAINAVFTNRATVLGARCPSAVAGALGVTPRRFSAGRTAAPAVSATGRDCRSALGIELITVPSHVGVVAIPSAQWLIGATVGTLMVVARLTTISARIGAPTGDRGPAI
jgi:hypothetical protein